MYKGKYILAIEASARNCSVAIALGDKVIANLYEPYPSMQAEKLIPMTDKVLKSSNLTLKDVDYLVTSKGPGSFTGIRIALSAAAGFLIANPRITPVILNNFTYYHWKAKQQVSTFDYSIVLIDAYRTGCYMAIFDSEDFLYQSYNFYFQDELIKFLTDFQIDKQLICSGNYLSQIYKSINNTNIILLPRFVIVQAKTLCKLAYENIITGNIEHNLEPLYISQAITN